MPATGFLTSEGLHEILRKPYHQGDMNIGMQYLVSGLEIGPHRVMLKRNFDTACWIPPVGTRDSHSIYYGDRMLSGLIDRFAAVEKLEDMPTAKEFAKKHRDAAEAERAAAEAEALAEAAAAAAAAGATGPTAAPAGVPVPAAGAAATVATPVAAAAAAAAGAPAPAPVAKPKGKAKGKGKGKPAVTRSLKTLVLHDQLAWLKDNLKPDQWTRFVEWMHKAVQSYGRHEREHARRTPTDMKMLRKDLAALSIPFSWWNLFEDSRIEHWSRLELTEKFEWLLFEEMAPPNSPWNLFLRCIQLEGDPDREALDSEEPYRLRPERSIGHIADSVETYYKRAIACTTTFELFPILQEFLAEFKEDNEKSPPPSSGKGSSSGSGGGGTPKPDPEPGEEDEEEDEETSGADLTTAAEAADEGDKFFDDFDRDAEVVGGTDPAGAAADEAARDKLKGPAPKDTGEGGGPGSSGLPESIEPDGVGGLASEDKFLHKKPGAIDATFRKRVAGVVAMLMRMFKTHNLPTATENPGRRMSSRHLARGELRFIQNRVYGGKGKRKFHLIYDCSGSMAGGPDREGKVLLLAFNELARRGYLVGKLILSGYPNGKPGWLSYSFPVAEEVILRIRTNHGSEGLQFALQGNLKDIMNADDVFVYTDANICDAPLNRDFFARRKVWPVGLYVGSPENAGEMERHFPQNIIRDTIEQVVATMLTRNRRTVG